MSRPDLRRLVADLAAQSERWADRVRHNPARRTFECVLDDPAVEAWLICWMPGHDTGFHDHDLSSGAVTVVRGEVREDRLHLGEGMSTAVYGPGDVFDFEPADIHRVRHTGSAPAVTLHAYSPRLRRMGAYSIARDGLLRRHPLAHGEELRPLEAI